MNSRHALFFVACLLMLNCKSTPTAEQRTLRVFAAASLRDAFTAIGEQFKATHPDTKVEFNFAGTQELHTQLDHGAAADVFAAADLSHVEALNRAGRLKSPQIFALNEPVIVVDVRQRERVHGLADLPALERLVLGAPQVPIGRYTRQIFEKASSVLGADFAQRCEARVVSRELNVKQVLARVSQGEAQAGIVYRTDVHHLADPKLQVVEIEKTFNVTAEYPIAIVNDAPHEALARDWVALVLSPQGQALVKQHGFVNSPSTEPAR